MNGRCRTTAEAGMVTSEFALITPIYFFVVFLMLGGLVGAWKTIEVSNEAKEIAREYSIGGSREIAESVSDSGAAVNIDVSENLVYVTVTRHGTGVYDLIGIDFIGQHRAVVEPGVRDG